MEGFLNRYRNITVLLLVILAQLVLLAVQVRNAQDVRMIRVWTVTAVTPLARVIEGFRGGGVGIVRNYFLLHDTNAENRRLQADVDRLKIENIFLKDQLNTADRAKALQVFQEQTPSKTLAARVIGLGPGVNSHMVFVDRGSLMGVERGMAVVTPDGIVGKVIAAYPITSEVLLITDPDFAAGVISQKSQIKGTLKGQGTPQCKVDYIPSEQKIDAGDWFYTSGDDRIFPRGFPVGPVTSARAGEPFKQIYLEPSGLRHGLEDVLILITGVHVEIPDTPPASQVYIAPPVPAPAQPTAAPNADAGSQPAGAAVTAAPGNPGTEADKLRVELKALGDAQKHTFGIGPPGSKPPDFTKLGQPQAGGQAPVNGGQGTAGAAKGSTNATAPAPKKPATSAQVDGASQSASKGAVSPSPRQNNGAASPGPRPPAPGTQQQPAAPSPQVGGQPSR